jgi:pyruvate kinase
MEVMRINCAHDGVAQWEAMIRNLRDAETATGRSCRVMCDLAGPKLRTGRIEDAPRVIKVRPQRDALGEVVAPAQVWLTPSDAMAPPPYEVDASVPVDRAIAEAASDGDVLRIVDARSKRREIFIVANEGTGCVGELDRTSYIEEDAPLRLHRKKGRNLKGVVGEIPTQAAPILVFPEDTLYLTRSDTPGRLPTRHSDGTLAEPAQLPCTLDDVFADVQAGERILFDDGKIAGVISDARPDQLAVCITHANPRGAKLAADKGINLPDSTLQLPSLTEKDLLDLEFIVQHADMVSLSFVRKPEDVLLLEDHLERLGGERLGIVLKIETKQGFERLPRLLLASLRSPPVGVMVARGDLAVEIGFERLAEVQEEILWLCEAAHVPVIWATQVLENLAKRGAPSRAEVTDAAMSSRAECVMLNKGPHIVEAVRFLAGVLERMAYHQHKKRAMLRKLSISQFA